MSNELTIGAISFDTKSKYFKALTWKILYNGQLMQTFYYKGMRLMMRDIVNILLYIQGVPEKSSFTDF